VSRAPPRWPASASVTAPGPAPSEGVWLFPSDQGAGRGGALPAVQLQAVREARRARRVLSRAQAHLRDADAPLCRRRLHHDARARPPEREDAPALRARRCARAAARLAALRADARPAPRSGAHARASLRHRRCARVQIVLLAARRLPQTSQEKQVPAYRDPSRGQISAASGRPAGRRGDPAGPARFVWCRARASRLRRRSPATRHDSPQ
jgi:hypothetical protein